MSHSKEALSEIAETAAKAAVVAHIEMVRSSGPLRKLCSFGSNTVAGLLGAVVAWIAVAWCGEYRDKSDRADRRSEAALAQSKAAEETANAARDAAAAAATQAAEVSKAVKDATVAINARVGTLTSDVALVQANLAALPQAAPPAAEVQALQEKLIKAQEKAIYRQQSIGGD